MSIIIFLIVIFRRSIGVFGLRNDNKPVFVTRLPSAHDTTPRHSRIQIRILNLLLKIVFIIWWQYYYFYNRSRVGTDFTRRSSTQLIYLSYTVRSRGIGINTKIRHRIRIFFIGQLINLKIFKCIGNFFKHHKGGH